jgi:hypothetical protein
METDKAEGGMSVLEWIDAHNLTYVQAAHVLGCSASRVSMLYHGQTEPTQIELVRLRSSMGDWSEAELIRYGSQWKVRIGRDLLPVAPGQVRAIKAGKIKAGPVQIQIVRTRIGEAVKVKKADDL